MTFPAAEGVRLPWDDVPTAVRDRVAQVLGSPVVEVTPQRGGFSPGVAARVVTSAGTRAFVKLVPEALNAQSAAMHREEVVALSALGQLVDLPVPRLLAAVDTHGWVGLVVTDVEGRSPSLPWRQEELGRVLAATARFAETTAPAALPSAHETLLQAFSGWRTLLADPPPALPPDVTPSAAGAGRAGGGVAAAAEGDRLLHGDLRADNVLLTAHGAVVVDWPAACRGAPLLDLVLLAPSVAMQGGPAPAELLAHTQVGRAATADEVAPLVCAFAGYLTQRSLQPPPPGLPTVHGFQAAQAEHANRWLVELIGS